MNSTRISQEWLKVTESFSVSPTHSWLFGVMFMTPDWESVVCEFEFLFLERKYSLISLILKTRMFALFILEAAITTHFVWPMYKHYWFDLIPPIHFHPGATPANHRDCWDNFLYLGVYYACNMSLVMISIFLSAIVINISRKGDSMKPVPHLVKKVGNF